MLGLPLGFAQIVLSVGNPNGCLTRSKRTAGDRIIRDVTHWKRCSRLSFLAEDASSPVRCFRDGSFIPCPARQRLPALPVASCMISAVDSFSQLAIKLWRA